MLRLTSLRIFIDEGVDLSGRSAEILEFEICNQYAIQGDLFSKSIRHGTELPLPLEGSVSNMAVSRPSSDQPDLTDGKRRS
jgi:hypothetical protein